MRIQQNYSYENERQLTGVPLESREEGAPLALNERIQQLNVRMQGLMKELYALEGAQPLDIQMPKETEMKIKKLRRDIIQTAKEEEVFLAGHLREMRRQVIEELKAGTLSGAAIAKKNSQLLKQFIGNLYVAAEETLKNKFNLLPPCKYCVAVLGSLGRDEAGLYSDIDNMIVLEGDSESKAKNRYFTKLNQYVADRIFRLGESLGTKLGVRFCQFNLNAPYLDYSFRGAVPSEDPKDTMHRGKTHFLAHLNTPLITDFKGVIDGEAIAGSDLQLYERYRQAVLNTNGRTYVAGYLMYASLECWQGSALDPSPVRRHGLTCDLNIKDHLYRPLQIGLSALAHYYDIQECNSIQRIRKLVEKGGLNAGFAVRLEKAMDLLMKYRVQLQAEYGEEFEQVALDLPALETHYRRKLEEYSAILQALEDLKRQFPDDPDISKQILRAKEWCSALQESLSERIPKLEAHNDAAFSAEDKKTLEEVVMQPLFEFYNKACCTKHPEAFDPAAFL